MSIALSLGNNLTTGGIFKPTAVNNTSVNNVTDFASVTGDVTLVLLSTQTASASASISFTTGIDSTYDEYIFKFINIKVSTNEAEFGFLPSINGGSSYGVTSTNTTFRAFHNEDDSNAGLNYVESFDLAQSTGLNNLAINQGNNSDDSYSGTLHLFNPSSTTYVKHFFSCGNNSHNTAIPLNVNNYLAGYVNSTSAINAIQFKADSGTFDGIIKMYGVAKS